MAKTDRVYLILGDLKLYTRIPICIPMIVIEPYLRYTGKIRDGNANVPTALETVRTASCETKLDTEKRGVEHSIDSKIWAVPTRNKSRCRGSLHFLLLASALIVSLFLSCMLLLVPTVTYGYVLVFDPPVYLVLFSVTPSHLIPVCPFVVFFHAPLSAMVGNLFLFGIVDYYTSLGVEIETN